MKQKAHFLEDDNMAKKTKKHKAKASITKRVNRNDAKIWKAMKNILDHERWDAVYSDERLSGALKSKGVLASPNVVRRIRLAHNVGSIEARRFDLYSKQYRD